jgi:hypothetical protein
MYLCIYLFIFFFFFKKILVFLICSIMKIIFFKNCIFVWLDAGPPIFPKDFFNRNGTSRGPPQRLPWPPCPALPCPCPVCHQLHRERAVTGRIFQALPNFCPHRQTDGQTDTMFAFIYNKIDLCSTTQSYLVSLLLKQNCNATTVTSIPNRFWLN